ncbi:hypothetical protein [Streptomyces sp. MUM 203J]|nr:hypothetical protein [Streptomyces sp. MUM 203J]
MTTCRRTGRPAWHAHVHLIETTGGPTTGRPRVTTYTSRGGVQ